MRRSSVNTLLFDATAHHALRVSTVAAGAGALEAETLAEEAVAGAGSFWQPHAGGRHSPTAKKSATRIAANVHDPVCQAGHNLPFFA